MLPSSSMRGRAGSVRGKFVRRLRFRLVKSGRSIVIRGTPVKHEFTGGAGETWISTARDAILPNLNSPERKRGVALGGEWHMDVQNLKAIASAIRQRVIELSHKAGTPHLGSSLSCVDILVALYWSVLRIDPCRPDDPLRDRFILSKGHAALALYVTLARRGFFPESLLDTYNQDGGCLAEHPGPGCVPGVEAATGSLGHGLPLGLGMALGGRIRKQDYRVFVLMSDGECNE